MTRDEIREEILKINSNNILMLLATSVGKSKLALDYLTSLYNQNPGKLLIVVPRNVLIDNWKDEMKKWGTYDLLIPITTFVTYVSLPKINMKDYAWTIYDECHHLSSRCLDHIYNNTTNYNILLSATVKKNHLIQLKQCFSNLYVFKLQLKEAIDNNILPDPKVYLLPLYLNNTKQQFTIVRNKGKQKKIVVNYNEHKKYIFNKEYNDYEITILCTQRQYYDNLNSLIFYYKKRSYISVYKNKWLKLCSDRLKWLSEQKTEYTKELLKLLDDKRTLTFCCSIDQTEKLGEHCINSKNKKSVEILNNFQEHKIDHITACDMLNEGLNLKDCQIGIFTSLHSSDIIIAQRNGRLLRHQEPIFIIPYFVNTREEEIVNTMLMDYNKDLVNTTNIDEITL